MNINRSAKSQNRGRNTNTENDPTYEVECVRVIEQCKPRSITDKFAMGDALRKLDARLASERGAFTKVLKTKLKMSRPTATNLMKLAAAVRPEDRETVSNEFDLGALYELTRSKESTQALAAAIESARAGDHITAAIAKRLLVKQATADREGGIVVLPDTFRIECCDMRSFEVEPASVDIVLTDPPYDLVSVLLYEEVAKLAARCLRPGGWCLAYAGKMYLARIHYRMKKHLDYAFQFDVPHLKPTLIKSLGIEQNAKYIVAYRHQPGKPWWNPVSDRVVGKVEKTLHKWQQPIEEAEQLIRALCPQGGVVLDPMCGSGTSLAAALNLGCQVIGADIDPEAVQITKKRLANVLCELHRNDLSTSATSI